MSEDSWNRSQSTKHTMSAQTGSWAQLRQQARSLETQVRISIQDELTRRLTRRTDRLALPHILTVQLDFKHTAQAKRRRESYGVSITRYTRKAIRSARPAHTSPRFRIFPISSEVDQSRATQRNTQRAPDGILADQVTDIARSRPCQSALEC